MTRNHDPHGAPVGALGPSITIRGVTLTANSDEDDFRALEATLQVRELAALREVAAIGGGTVTYLLGAAVISQGRPFSADDVAVGAAVARRYTAWVARTQTRVSEWYLAHLRLERETARDRLPADRLTALRALLPRLPSALRARWQVVLAERASQDDVAVTP